MLNIKQYLMQSCFYDTIKIILFIIQPFLNIYPRKNFIIII